MTSRYAALCHLLDIRYPIIQSGMSRVAGAELVAEVSRAGALGILAALRLAPDELRAQIRRLRELTDRPFGVNLWLHPAIARPISPDTVPDATLASVQEKLNETRSASPGPTLASVQEKLNEFRSRLGVPPSTSRPPAFPDLVMQAFEVILEERVPVWSIGLGNPGAEMVGRCHERGIRVMAMVTNVEDARAVAAAGVDIIVAQGAEAGGHRSRWQHRTDDAGTIVLVPEIADAVEQPVVAAGGIADGRGLVAALALGASGVMLGTRFIAAREAIAPQFFKDAVLTASSGDTVVSDAFTGLPMRALRNRFASEYGAAPVLPPILQGNAAEDIFKAAAARGDREHVPMPAGESTGLVSEVLSASDIVASLVREAGAVVQDLQSAWPEFRET